MKKEMICISCPLGCRLVVSQDEDGSVGVTGNQCPRGEVYGREEFSAPKRIVTATVKTKSLKNPYVPVKTDKPLLREHIRPLLRRLYGMTVGVPVSCGDILIHDVEGTGTNVVFTRSLGE
ncbi:MAG: DUF1667 domain-containing protein [Spirochaetales bacterium]|nr:DUF1667 domain-containing protein [Spirochaetales bacterium]